MHKAIIRTGGFVAGLVLLTASVARAQTPPAPKPADAPNTAGTPKASDAAKPAEGSKSAAGAAIPVGITKPGDAAKPVTPPAGAPTPAAPAAIDWKSMDKKARKAYMKTKVTPEMKKAFQAYDAKRYKTFNCTTCHGDGAVKGDFKMPNAKLPRLPKDMAGFKALGEKKPEAMKFMGGEVKPKMAALLNMPEYKPEHPTGFGCNACHMSEGQ